MRIRVSLVTNWTKTVLHVMQDHFFATEELFTWERVFLVVEKEDVDSVMDC